MVERLLKLRSTLLMLWGFLDSKEVICAGVREQQLRLISWMWEKNEVNRVGLTLARLGRLAKLILSNHPFLITLTFWTTSSSLIFWITFPSLIFTSCLARKT